MEAVIETYRGYEIRFNIYKETFVCDIDDSGSVKKSYSALKKFIDEWLKDTANFKKFKVIKNPLSNYGGADGIIIGQRKDGRYVMQKADGTKEQVSEHYLKDHWVLTASVIDGMKPAEPLIAEREKLNKQDLELRKEINMIYKSINAQTLEDYKKQQSNLI